MLDTLKVFFGEEAVPRGHLDFFLHLLAALRVG